MPATTTTINLAPRCRRAVVALIVAGLLAALLAVAAAPAGAGADVLVEVGVNDRRLSHMGPDLDTEYDAGGPDVAYNPTADEYLVVWSGDDDTDGVVEDEREVFAQRLNGAGEPIGDRTRVSDMGPDGNSDFDAVEPAVVYNSADQEYLVVWSGEDDNFGLVDGEYEIFGQRLSATGSEVGVNDVRISGAGGSGDPDYRASRPAVAYNPDDNEYLVAWHGDDDTGGLVDNEFEVFAQRLSADGFDVGVDDFRISDVGGIGDAAYDAGFPSVAYNPDQHEYLVTWRGDDNTGGLVDNEFEVFAQRLTWNGGAKGVNDFRVSDMGGTGDADYEAEHPSVTYNPTDNEYLVTWQGDDNTGGLANNEYEIFAQRLTGTGVETGANDFRVSDVGGTGTIAFVAYAPAVAYNPTANEYLVTWWGNDNIGNLIPDEPEVFAQRLSWDGADVGDNDVRISDMGPDGAILYLAELPAVAHSSASDEYLVVWRGDDTVGGPAGEHEIYGQRLGFVDICLVIADHPDCDDGLPNCEVDPDHPNCPPCDPQTDPDCGGYCPLHPNDFENCPEQFCEAHPNDAKCDNGGGGESVYALVTRRGDVHAFPESFYVGDPDLPVGVEAVDIVLSPTHEKGYYVLGSDGRVYPVGDGLADFGGIDLAALPEGDRTSELLVYPEESGATVFTRRGGAFGLGDAPELENLYHLDLVGDVVSMTLHEFGGWGAGEDGGVFTYNDTENLPGTVPFCGSLYDELAPGVVPNSAVTTIYATEGCYTMLGAKGGVYNFGGSPYYGSLYEPEHLGPNANTILAGNIVTGTRVIGEADVLFENTGGVFVINADHDDPDFEFQGSVVGKLGHLLPADNLIVAGDAHTT